MCIKSSHCVSYNFVNDLNSVCGNLKSNSRFLIDFIYIKTASENLQCNILVLKSFERQTFLVIFLKKIFSIFLYDYYWRDEENG